MTDVSAGFRPPCWCPCTWAPAWRLHTNLYKFGENVSSHIFHEKNCCDLNLGESLCICTFYLFPDSGLNLLNGFDFLFWSILNGVTLVTLKTSNSKGHLSVICNVCTFPGAFVRGANEIRILIRQPYFSVEKAT